MKAVVLREFGGPEVLRLEEVPTPSPSPGEVLVKVHAVSVNRTLDLKVRLGEYDRRVTLPLVLGVDPSGEVVAVGEGVLRPVVGNRVAIQSHVRCGKCQFCQAGEDADCTDSYSIGVHRWGGYAEYVVAPAGNAFLVPENLSFPEATVISRHYPTAFLLAGKAGLQAGEWALVMGAAGALGSCLVQVARALGARVIAAAGSDQRVAAAVSYGADHGVNYRTSDLAAEVRKLTDGHGADVVFENIADPTLWPGAFGSLASHGRLVTAGAHGGGIVPLDVKRLYLQRLRIIGAAGANKRDIERAIEAGAAGEVRAIIDRVLPLSRAAEAHRVLEANAALGKVILDPTRG